jgi:hypothetical protein
MAASSVFGFACGLILAEAAGGLKYLHNNKVMGIFAR